MCRLEAIEEVDKWWDNTVSTITEEQFYDLYEVYCKKLESIDVQCEGYTDFEDVPELRV